MTARTLDVTEREIARKTISLGKLIALMDAQAKANEAAHQARLAKRAYQVSPCIESRERYADARDQASEAAARYVGMVRAS